MVLRTAASLTFVRDVVSATLRDVPNARKGPKQAFRIALHLARDASAMKAAFPDDNWCAPNSEALGKVDQLLGAVGPGANDRLRTPAFLRATIAPDPVAEVHRAFRDALAGHDRNADRLLTEYKWLVDDAIMLARVADVHSPKGLPAEFADALDQFECVLRDGGGSNKLISVLRKDPRPYFELRTLAGFLDGACCTSWCQDLHRLLIDRVVASDCDGDGGGGISGGDVPEAGLSTVSDTEILNQVQILFERFARDRLRDRPREILLTWEAWTMPTYTKKSPCELATDQTEVARVRDAIGGNEKPNTVYKRMLRLRDQFAAYLDCGASADTPLANNSPDEDPADE